LNVRWISSGSARFDKITPLNALSSFEKNWPDISFISSDRALFDLGAARRPQYLVWLAPGAGETNEVHEGYRDEAHRVRTPMCNPERRKTMTS